MKFRPTIKAKLNNVFDSAEESGSAKKMQLKIAVSLKYDTLTEVETFSFI